LQAVKKKMIIAYRVHWFSRT